MIRGDSRGERVPTAVLMSGSGSNARKLLEYARADRSEVNYEVRLILSDNPDSNYLRIAEEHGVQAELNDIYAFFGVAHPQQGLAAEDRRKLKDPSRREGYDRRNDAILRQHGVQLVALAGYDWVVAPFLCLNYIVLNVHPGDLRVRDSGGRRLYIGLGWIPTAKAILAGEDYVHSTTHVVTAQLDGGPIARVSQRVPIDLPVGITPANILPKGVELGRVIRSVRNGDDPGLASSLLVTHSRAVQERLKELGDWIEFPRTVDQVAALMRSGRLVRRSADGCSTTRRSAEGCRAGDLLLDGRPLEDLFLQNEKAAEEE